MTTKTIAKIIVNTVENELAVLSCFSFFVAVIPLGLYGVNLPTLMTCVIAYSTLVYALVRNQKRVIKLTDWLNKAEERENEYKVLAEKEKQLAVMERENFLKTKATANLWDNLMSCKHVVFVGGIDTRLPAGKKINLADAADHNYTHIAVEFWMTDHPTLAPLDTKLGDHASRCILMNFANQCRNRRLKR